MILDTHATIWFLMDVPRLSRRAVGAVESVLAGGERLKISVVSLVELTYLIEKQRVPPDTQAVVEKALDESRAFELVPFDRDTARAMARVPREQVPDMPDRMIGATALHLDVPLVTADLRLRHFVVTTIW